MVQGVRATGDLRKIFIVHGRDVGTRDQLIKFLKHIDGLPISWNEARNATGKPSPTTLEVVAAGLSIAQAVVVLFTSDDRAQLLPQFLQTDDGVDERELTGQARQNVLLEAGMALGMDASRTVLVRYGRPRRISDIEGVNWLTLSDNYEDRRALVDALINAGAKVDERRNLVDYDHAGKFYDDTVRWKIRWDSDGLPKLSNGGPGVAKKTCITWIADGKKHRWEYEEFRSFAEIHIKDCGLDVIAPTHESRFEISWTNPDGIRGIATVNLADWPKSTSTS